MKLTLIDRKKEAGDAQSFIFKPGQPVSWKPGYFIHYILPHQDMDKRKNDRYFTISSTPHEGFIMLTTRITPNGSSFKKMLLKLKPGDIIEAEEPEGDFVIEGPNKKYVFIAGGIGITPFRAIILDLAYRKQLINTILLYANKTADFVFKDELEALSKDRPDFQIHYFVDPQRIDQEVIRKLVPDLKNSLFYVSGPEPMVESFEEMLMNMGIPDKHIKRDYFPGYTWPIS